MKKIICMVLALALCLSAFAACGKDKPHTCAYGEWSVTKLPTQELPGEAKRSCSCGAIESLALPTLADSGYSITGDTATLEQEGVGLYSITVDGVAFRFEAATPKLIPPYEDVVTSPDFVAALTLAGGEKAKSGEDITVGKFTFGAGCYFETSNGGHFTGGNVNTQKKDITFTLEGSVNSVKFDVRGASSSGCVLTLVYLPEGGEAVEIYKSEELASGDFVPGIEITDLQPGVYRIVTSGSARIGDFFITERLERSEPVAIEVFQPKNKVLAGRELNTDGLSVELVYGNGRHDSVKNEDYTVDFSQVDSSKPGVYTAAVTHTPTGFTAQYDITVYGVDSISLSDHALDASRVTHPVQKLYLAGSSYDNYDNLCVIASCSAPGVDGAQDFRLTSGEYTVQAATKENPVVTVSAFGCTASYGVTILELSDKVNKSHVIVDQNATPGEGADGVVTVNSINDALKLMELLNAPRYSRKTITLYPGTYYEKVDISLPYLTVQAAQGVKAEEIVVTYDALNGLTDPSGTSGYSTDGSATFSVRAEAINFCGKGFTIENYYNTHERYELSKTIAGAGTQAVALLVRADKCVFEDMRLSSYQDTLYAENGRHIYRNCYIEGRTDYIFGNDATAYFTGCTIQSTGAGLEEKNGGYVVTTKGGNSSAHVAYGFIFDGCVFQGDEKVQPGSVSVARGWDQYMTVMVMNSTLDDSFSLEAYGDTASPLNDRYTKMNADPVAAQLFEYNNAGPGALTADIIATAKDGVIENLCAIPAAEDAAKYGDFAVIFASRNGSCVYNTDWDGTVE